MCRVRRCGECRFSEAGGVLQDCGGMLNILGWSRDLGATGEPRDGTLVANVGHTTDAIAQLVQTGRPVWPESAEKPQ